MEHARYGGSTYSRTRKCPPWAKYSDRLPKQKSSADADRGTLCHNAMEEIYTGSPSSDQNFDERSVIGSEYKGIALTEDLYERKIVRAIAAVEAIFDRFNVAEEDFFCESRVVISEISWGTSDLLATGEISSDDELVQAQAMELGPFDPGQMLRVGICLDYKFGDGIPVHALDNDQGRFYSGAASITKKTERFFADIDLVAIGIIQPNERGSADFSLWLVRASILHETVLEALEAEAVAEASDPEDPHQFVAGGHCRWCPARGLCPATSGEVAALNRLDVTAPELIKNIPHFDQLAQAEGTIAAYRKLVHAQIEEGVDLTDKGYKVVPKRASRSYIDEAEVRARIKKSRKIKREEAYTDKLKSPTQMEKVFKKKGLDFGGILGDQIQKVSTGTTLVGIDDKRKALPGAAALRAALARD